MQHLLSAFLVLLAFVLLGVALGVAIVQYRRAVDAREAAVVAKARLESLLTRMVRSELVASLALEHTRQGVWDLNLVTGVTAADDGFKRIMGRDPLVDPLRDETWTRTVHPDDIETVRTRLRAHTKGDDLFEAQFRVQTSDGSWIWIDSRGRVVERDANGNAVRMVGTIRDITEQHRNREQLRAAEDALRDAQRIEAVGRLAGGVAHHINNKMLVVLGRADMLATMAATPRQQSTIDSIRRAATETAEICRQLLAHGQRQFLQPVGFELDPLVAEVSAAMAGTPDSGLRIELSLQSCQERCYADPAQIEWVLRNLVENARDAVDDSGVIRISTKVMDLTEVPAPEGVAQGRYVAVSVADNGPGLTADAAAHIFEPFFTTKDVGEGEGLGLATCYGILKQSNGHLTVESQSGKGTTFTMLVPST